MNLLELAAYFCATEYEKLEGIGVVSLDLAGRWQNIDSAGEWSGIGVSQSFAFDYLDGISKRMPSAVLFKSTHGHAEWRWPGNSDFSEAREHWVPLLCSILPHPERARSEHYKAISDDTDTCRQTIHRMNKDFRTHLKTLAFTGGRETLRFNDNIHVYGVIDKIPR